MGFIRDRLTQTGARLAEFHPYSWKLAWEAARRLPILLPHDPTYNALRHFIRLKPRGLFLDVGANNGLSALSFRKFSRDYRILSIEPNPLLEPNLRSIKERDPQFDYRIIAAGPHRGQGTFFVAVYKNVVLHTFTSQNRDHLLEAIVTSFGTGVARKVRIETFDSEIIPLDELNLAPTIIKIDAEGSDYAILQGLRETVRQMRPFVIIEVETRKTEVVDYFRNQDYALMVYNVTKDCFALSPQSFAAASMRNTPQNRNLFAVPQELAPSLPILRPSAGFRQTQTNAVLPNS